MIFFTGAPIAFRPGRVGGALGVSEQNRDTQTLDLAQQLAGAKGIEVRLEASAIQTSENFEAALLLPAQFENVAEKSDS
jgi:hypothetical protein